MHELQKTLDKQGIEIVENQKENMVGRKKLAEQTRGESELFSCSASWFGTCLARERARSLTSSLLTEFKKVSEEEKGPAFKTLLKGELSSPTRSTPDELTPPFALPAYQGEIDALTKRSKIAESSFLNVYKLLAEAPDPFPLLDAAVVRSPPSLVCRSEQLADCHHAHRTKLLVHQKRVCSSLNWRGRRRRWHS